MSITSSIASSFTRSIANSIINSIDSFWGGGRGVGVESGGDLCVVRVIKFNVIYYRCLSLALTLVLALSPN